MQYFGKEINDPEHKYLTAEIHPNRMSSAKSHRTYVLWIDGWEYALALLIDNSAQESTYQKPTEIGQEGQVVSAAELCVIRALVLRQEKPHRIGIRPRTVLGASTYDKRG